MKILTSTSKHTKKKAGPARPLITNQSVKTVVERNLYDQI